TWSPRVISKLETTVRAASDDDLFRVNPIEWAQSRNIDEYEAVDLFLYSAKAGLFSADWNLICPCCGAVMRSLRNLHKARSRNVCPVCFRDDSSRLDDYVQVTFTISPSIRSIVFHHPEDLPLEDYAFKYLFARNASIPLDPELTIREFIESVTHYRAEVMPGD